MLCRCPPITLRFPIPAAILQISQPVFSCVPDRTMSTALPLEPRALPVNLKAPLACLLNKLMSEIILWWKRKWRNLKKRGGIILKNRQGQKEEKSKRKNMVWFVKNTGVVPSCLQLSACSWRLKRFWLQGIPRSLIPSAAPELSGNSLLEDLSLEQLVSSFTVGKTKTNTRQRTGWEVWWYAQQTGGHKIEEALILLEDLGGE